MCGILAWFNTDPPQETLERAKNTLRHRGQDDAATHGTIHHCLHAINNHITQPLHDDNHTFAANCEIYNPPTEGRNDADALYRHLQQAEDIPEALHDIDGVYALIYQANDTVWIARDPLGVKPLWYNTTDGLVVASEHTAIKQLNRTPTELNPRHILEYDIPSNTVTRHKRDFFPHPPATDTATAIQDAVTKRIQTDKSIGLLYTGGVDSALLAHLLQQANISFTAYAAGITRPSWDRIHDIEQARHAADQQGIDLNTITATVKDIETILPRLTDWIGDTNVTKLAAAIPLHLAAQRAKKDDVKILLTGHGVDEAFAGYHRMQDSTNVNSDCRSALRQLYETTLYATDVICMHHNIEPRLPYLDHDVINAALTTPGQEKLPDKQSFRNTAIDLCLSNNVATTKRRAPQHGSNATKALDTLTNTTKADLLDGDTVRIAALLSTGKDSILATHIMLERNYDLACFITIQSDNQDSYMYHGPNTNLAQLQADAAQTPLITATTQGDKETELDDLKDAIKQAIDEHNIQGIVTGAIESTYQRDRIETICDDLGIKTFNPLWQMDQAQEVKTALDNNIEFIFVKIAAYGLDTTWLGHTIAYDDLKKLQTLHDDLGINIAGEGGEYETFVTNAPFFTHAITIDEATLQKENEHTATLTIHEAHLT